MAQFEYSVVLEFRVCFSYRVVAYYDFLSKRSNSGELIAGTEYARVYGMPDLLHKLQVEGLPEMRIEFEGHYCTSVSVQQVSLSVQAVVTTHDDLPRKNSLVPVRMRSKMVP